MRPRRGAWPLLDRLHRRRDPWIAIAIYLYAPGANQHALDSCTPSSSRYSSSLTALPSTSCCSTSGWAGGGTTCTGSGCTSPSLSSRRACSHGRSSPRRSPPLQLTDPRASGWWPSTGRTHSGYSGCEGDVSRHLTQDLDVPIRSVHADPLPIPDQPGGMLHPHDGRQAVLPCDHRAMVIRPPTSVTRPLIATNTGVQLGSV